MLPLLFAAGSLLIILLSYYYFGIFILQDANGHENIAGIAVSSPIDNVAGWRYDLQFERSMNSKSTTGCEFKSTSLRDLESKNFGSEPLLIAGIISGWPAINVWNKQALLNKYGAR